MSNPRICTKPAAALAVSLFALASSASATIQCNSAAPMPYVVPATTAGVYVNLVTGVFNVVPASAPGWEFNPWGSNPNGLKFFWPGAPAGSYGGVAVGTVYSVLAAGATIGPAQTYSTDTGDAGAANWKATNSGQYFGIKFYNEGTATVNYGWIQLNTTAPAGHPATINAYCYEDNGTAITAATTPVELQSFSVE